jgi:hypothetical protein
MMRPSFIKHGPLRDWNVRGEAVQARLSVTQQPIGLRNLFLPYPTGIPRRDGRIAWPGELANSA